VETARPAAEGDLDALASLWRHALEELDGQRGGWALAGSIHRDDVDAFLRSALDDPDRLLAVGLIDGVPVGVASLRADRDRREPLGYLELIYVEPNARQVGVADAMLALVTARCGEWGMAGLDAPALPGNRSAKSFFETQGMQARLLIMHRPRPPGAETDE
jgi:GNAT superfamily N-acetyltransferase